MMASGSRHEESWLLLPWLANGRLPAAERARVEEHVRECEQCAREVAWQRLACQALAEPDRITYAPAPSFRKLMERIDGRPAAPRQRPAARMRGLSPAVLAAWRPPGLAWAASFVLLVGFATLAPMAYRWSQPLYATHTAPAPLTADVLHIAFERSLVHRRGGTAAALGRRARSRGSGDDRYFRRRSGSLSAAACGGCTERQSADARAGGAAAMRCTRALGRAARRERAARRARKRRARRYLDARIRARRRSPRWRSWQAQCARRAAACGRAAAAHRRGLCEPALHGAGAGGRDRQSLRRRRLSRGAERPAAGAQRGRGLLPARGGELADPGAVDALRGVRDHQRPAGGGGAGGALEGCARGARAAAAGISHPDRLRGGRCALQRPALRPADQPRRARHRPRPAAHAGRRRAHCAHRYRGRRRATRICAAALCAPVRSLPRAPRQARCATAPPWRG